MKKLLVSSMLLLLCSSIYCQRLGQTYKSLFDEQVSLESNFQAHDFDSEGKSYRTIIITNATSALHCNFVAKRRDDAPLVNLQEYFKLTPEGQKELDKRISWLNQNFTLVSEGKWRGKAYGSDLVEVHISTVESNNPTFNLFWLKQMIVVNKL